jgi:ParB family transcriptional regulator, chromosome partitioning protein
MKAAAAMRAKLGANINESMGVPGQGGGGAVPGLSVPPHPAIPIASDQYRGCTRIKDALAIELERLVPDPNQPRKEFDQGAQDDLAASLKARGQLQPCRVRWDTAMGKWIIIAGERRYRAALQAGLPTLACIEAKGPMTADEILEDQLVENCLREDLKPIEQAKAFQALIQRRGWSYRQLADALKISLAAIGRAMALLELPPDVREKVDIGELSPTTAYEVSRLKDEIDQRDLVARAITEKLNQSEVRAAVKEKTTRSSRAARWHQEKYDYAGNGSVSVTVPADASRPHAVIALLSRALKQANDAAHAASSGEVA